MNTKVVGFWVVLFAVLLFAGAYIQLSRGKTETGVMLAVSGLCPGIIGVNMIVTSRPKSRPPV